MSTPLATDGSAELDAPAPVEIDLEDPIDRWRYAPECGHRNWEPTNGGCWCRSCSRAHDVEDPHYAELVDAKTGETVPWSAIRLVE